MNVHLDDRGAVFAKNLRRFPQGTRRALTGSMARLGISLARASPNGWSEHVALLDLTSKQALQPEREYVSNASTQSALTVPHTAAYPPSLVLSQKPSCWCNEACEWSDQSYGAPEANTGALCKFPAHIRAEGSTCTLP